MQWKIDYYNRSVKEAVDHLDKSIKSKFIAIVNTMLDEGPDLGMPFTKAMGSGLFEIRAKGHAGIARGFFCTIKNRKIVILHVFIKKTNKTPQKELELARKRLTEVKKYDI